ncbi:TATA-box-binding protein (plasmid) [Haloferax mediterranei ATCC 33500]|uniref:TATA-box-binding protein n=1 Tax=Haloferax mediterranei (strain ATCC 33500 / DSM 1411 / JCM 8866 / NBRC 14739 / NCIMB 2177 / R-4) TaxID=523841 RepID=I3RA68_HALMT|nr:TATA-box-binding protein [Haloferax mediterranei]AFK21128.1 TATA-binding transcription initiation factor [Haloferax mediterranei ATCC 33500]AHZ24287.1 transcription factor [Haloferax mediterranei ATCC 33500]EMA05371.1 transcription factor [Haloferax mediterranei ATCC 33500]MDX5989830.1 TATA-box-binding protein [Haloferax mediterranei ATCC 33500]QCQ77273.1 TATA-box-binding protein [Haloferax mediterranei ATCC 33500]
MSNANVTGSVEVQNVVASTEVTLELDLDRLSLDMSGTDYDPENFPGLVYRTENPKAACLVFRSGKIVCTGADSVEDVNTAIETLFDDLDDLGIPVPDDPNTTVQNIVSSADLGAALNLNALAIGLGLEDVEYEPEQFPGLVYRLDDPNVVVLMFGSGKIVITGAEAVVDAESALETVDGDVRELGLLG